uniref:ATP synthase complex subunit 8 n=1 Tax=Bostrichoidea sp. 9 KM-2017 TaxID=2219283 RepID=A0A346RH25_9COLE|nr:ATP synthase F0 subunit 8 [Bostrichoidea sp. 9 KM-2017]
MPQMAPLSWLTLFFYFTIIFLMINSLNYYNFNYKSITNKFTKTQKKINWKW